MGEYQHQEPEFRTSEGKDMSHLKKETPSENLQGLDLDITAPPLSSGIERMSGESIDSIREDLKDIWRKIQTDKQYLGIMAELVRGDFNSRDSLDINDVKEFYKRCHTKEEFNEYVKPLIDEIGQGNSANKHEQYKQKALSLAEILFPTR